MMVRLRVRPSVTVSDRTFGGIVYVPDRDDFFAVDPDVYAFLDRCRAAWLETSEFPGWRSLVELGICEESTGRVRQTAYSGVSFIGNVQEIPAISEPLVLNVFATSKCELHCRYCHADDLMARFSHTENDDDISAIITTALAVESMVAVVTGGDPAARPERAIKVIEALAPTRSIVLDTSGVGKFEALLPALVASDAHVRVSLDGRPEFNRRTRGQESFDAAERAIRAAQDAGLALTIQTVVSNVDGGEGEWENLYAWLVSHEVRHWVMHLAIPAGKNRPTTPTGRVRKGGAGPLTPNQSTRLQLRRFVESFASGGRALDLRVTDTDANPNSVLLVAGGGDLYTEGYAKRGKVRLYDGSSGRVDRLKSLWYHVDQFGHAERYLNYSRWRHRDSDLADLCVDVRPPTERKLDPSTGPRVVEVESKFAVADLPALSAALSELGFEPSPEVVQIDEYWDLPEGELSVQDYVVRLRTVDGRAEFSVKSPRMFQPGGSSSRFEFEVPVGESKDTRDALVAKGMQLVWVLEKRRVVYRSDAFASELMLDEVPVVGAFLEIEGSISDISLISSRLGAAIGKSERRNYKELVVAAGRSANPGRAIIGATYSDGLKFR